jgi:hypothetical protein
MATPKARAIATNPCLVNDMATSSPPRTVIAEAGLIGSSGLQRPGCSLTQNTICPEKQPACCDHHSPTSSLLEIPLVVGEFDEFDAGYTPSDRA